MAEVEAFIIPFVVAIGGEALVGDEVVKLAFEVDFSEWGGVFFGVPFVDILVDVVFIPAEFA